MKIEIKDIEKKDYQKAIDFAIKGMHFDWYLNSRLLLQAYGRYFWYLELNRATQIFGAYIDGTFAGVLLAEFKDECPKHSNLWEKLYVKLVDIVQRMFFKDSAGLYDQTTKEQLAHYLENYAPHGEIVFLAADPDAGVKGVGTALLQALEAVERGKTVYLHTDDACTYQFYEHRGFTRVEDTEIEMELPKGIVPLRCFVYSKEIQ